MELSECDPRFEIGPSTISGAGSGLFAKIALVPGDQLEVIGVLVPTNSLSDVCTAYTDRYKFRVGDRPLIPVGYGGMANHSSTPNMEKVIDGDRVYLRVVRPVSPGEEMLFCYSSYAQAQFADHGCGTSGQGD